ncbi:hypothetical protein [Ornithinibacillus contaminans]|uniref:hypothetical protein n=1 Tax=Ornithinibacillus contaminans TaxID=694055 RepID=UPI00064DA84E|nr:hypothetical protein [Ornithinibacillus contaminans]
MKKLFTRTFITITSLVALLAFSSVSEAASVSPSSQTIRGSTARADWNFTWSLSGAHAVRFNPGDGSGTRLWDSNNTVRLSKINFTYYSQEEWETYNPTFTAIRISDGTAQAATAQVQKRLP